MPIYTCVRILHLFMCICACVGACVECVNVKQRLPTSRNAMKSTRCMLYNFN